MTDTLLATTPDAIFHVNIQAATASSALMRGIQTVHGGHQPMDFEEIRAWTAEHKPHDLQHINVFLNKWGYGPAHLLSLSSDAPDKHTPAPNAFASLLEWYDVAFPKSRRGLHPRLDLGVPLDRYKKVREGVRRSICGCMGVYEARAERNALLDGWAEMLALLQPLTENEGPLDKRSFSLLKTFADLARRAHLEPWQLTGDMFDALEEVFVTAQDRELTKRAIRTLNEWNGIADFKDLLPPTPIPPLPARRLADDLPPHIEARIDQLVKTAATRIDINTSKTHNTVTQSTIDFYQAALRYHVKLLPYCPPDPDTAYDRPVSDLETVNDVDALFAPEHISATIRATEDREHLASAVQADSALSYYKTIRLILGRNDDAFDPGCVAEITRRIKSSEYFKGVDRDEMPEHLQNWCRDLVNDPDKERRFHNLHRILHAKAEKIMDGALDETGKFDADLLSEQDRMRVIRLGVCAAVCAIQLTGRPLRLRNAIWLRHRGRRANINPKAGWEFFIPAEEAKAGEKIPEMSPRKERHGPAVLDWYLKKIRPLIDPENKSIYLFPSISVVGGRLNPSTFRLWFQSAANDAGVPMTFHRFRHGFASILIRMGKSMRNIADMLANTEAVCSKRYAFLDPDRSAKQAQDAMVEAAAEAERTIRKRGRK
ncbi:MAG: site-specific integrase [Rhodobacteraceae bacterium]|nr:MAG: site-specific integrase [Paracoccaceae bacterium]